MPVVSEAILKMAGPQKEETLMMTYLADQMDGKDLKRAVHYCRGRSIINKADLKELVDFQLLFFKLKSKEAITTGEYGFLIEMFDDIPMPILSTHVKKIQQKMNGVPPCHQDPGPPFKFDVNSKRADPDASESSPNAAEKMPTQVSESIIENKKCENQGGYRSTLTDSFFDEMALADGAGSCNTETAEHVRVDDVGQGASKVQGHNGGDRKSVGDLAAAGATEDSPSQTEDTQVKCRLPDATGKYLRPLRPLDPAKLAYFNEIVQKEH